LRSSRRHSSRCRRRARAAPPPSGSKLPRHSKLKLHPLAPLRPSHALHFLTHFLQHFLHIQNVSTGNFPRLLRPPFDNCQVQLPMLTEQHVASLGTLFVHAANVGHHVALEQIEQSANGV